MMNLLWNNAVMDGIISVNHALHHGNPPERAAGLLYDIQCCLCSGDGLTPWTAFRSAGPLVTEKTLKSLGVLENVERIGGRTPMRAVRLSRNPYGLNHLYFLEDSSSENHIDQL